MRVKVETLAPLPPLKAWFSCAALSTVRDLKASLCAILKPLQDGRVGIEELILLLDDFELLDASSIDVVRDGDLIVYVHTQSLLLSLPMKALINSPLSLP